MSTDHTSPPQPPPGGPSPYAPQASQASQSQPPQAPQDAGPYPPPPGFGASGQGAPGFGAPGYGAPGYGAPGYPVPAPLPARPQRPGLGILAGIGAALAAALLYGLIIKATKHEIGFAAIAVGACVGYALGKIGGRNPVLPFVGVVLALLGVYAGQLFGISLLISAEGVSMSQIYLHHFGLLQDTWKDSLNAKDFFFLAIAGVEGYLFTRRVAN